MPTRLDEAPEPDDVLNEKTCTRFLGIFSLKGAKHLCCIEKTKKVGMLLDSPVHRIETISFIQVENVAERTSRERNKEIRSMIKNTIEGKGLYYCEKYPLTVTMQRLFNGIKEESKTINEDRFWFNVKHCKLLYEYKMDELVTPVIFGHFEVKCFCNIIAKRDTAK